MTNTKNTKHALLSSILALFLCFSMLLGTTWAWFTDSVTSANNIIKSGNLDIGLDYWDGDSWETVQGTNSLFTDNLWEPGHTEVVYLKLSNLGSLALKYQLAINVLSETEGTNMAGDPFKLSDYIQIGVVEGVNGETNAYADRAAAEEAVKSNSGIIGAGYAKQGNMLAGAPELYMAVVVYMPDTVENEANAKTGTPAPTINLGVQVLATQYTAESDSFNNQYDKDAWVSGMLVYSEADLNAAIANGGNIVLGADVELQSYVTVAEGANVAINLNGHKIRAVSGNVIRNSGELTIVNGTLEGTTTYTINNQSVNGSVTVKDVKSVNGGFFNAGTMVVNNCEITNTASGKHALVNSGDASTSLVVNGGTYSTTSGNAIVYAYSGTIVIDGGDFTQIGSSYMIDGSGITINGGTFTDDDGTWAIRGTNHTIKGGTFNFDPSAYVATSFKAVANNGAYYVVADTIDNVIVTADDLVALGGTKINGTYMLMADLDMSGKVMKSMEVSGGASVNFIGNDHTISNLTLNAAGIHGMVGASEVAGLFDLTAPATTVSLTVSDLTIKDATVACSKYAATVVGYNPNGGTTITLNNVDVAGATVTAESVAALVGYTTGALTMTDCDVSDLTLSGEFSENKVGAYVGTVNTATGVATVTNCTNNTAYKYAGRVIYDATMTVDGAYYVTTAAAFTSLMNGSESEVNIILADGKYENVLTSSNKTIHIVGENEDGAEIALTNAVSSSHDHLGLNGCTVTLKDLKVTFEDGAYYAAYINNPTMTYTNCTITGQFYIYGNTNFIACTFDNDDDAAKTAMRYTYIYDGNVLVDDCDFYTQGHALIMYSDNGGAGDQTLTVRNSRFHGGAGRTAYAVANQNTAGIEIDGSCGANYTLILEGNNTYDEGFSGLWRIKAMKDGVTTTVNDITYTGTSADVYLDGTHYTKDGNRNVTMG